MDLLKTGVNFIDAERIRARLEIEITDRNGYPEFTISGSYAGSMGQVQDHIKPANEAQRELIAAWGEYHLKDISNVAGFKKNIERIVTDIEKAEKRRLAGKEPKSGDDAILEDMEAEGIDEDMLDAVKAYISLGIESDDGLENFSEAYAGEWSSDEEFAESMAEQLGEIKKDVAWPYTCIDWEYAAKELMYDYSESNGYYFRNI